MIKRDYILRWTTELAKVMARMLGKEPELQINIIREAYDELLGLDLTSLDDLTLDEIIPYLSDQRGFNEGQLEFLAEMLYQEGKLQLELSQISTARRRLQEALLIFEFLDTLQDVYSLERHERMSVIRYLLDHN